MSTGAVLILDHDPQRRSQLGERLRASQFSVGETSSASMAITQAHHDKPDLILFRFGPQSTIQDFQKATAELPGAFIVPWIERNFSAKLRNEILNLNAPGFLNEDLPADESVATVRALLRQKRALEQRNGSHTAPPTHTAHQNGGATPLRERAPELYKAVLSRYEDAIKQALQHRIYKIDEDVFEPFRLIAKELFLANATARDAVELHYQTLRKIAPTPDSPRAQGYLEVGRTTIVGLMGDLLTYYREARGTVFFEATNESKSTAPLRTDRANHEQHDHH